MISRLAFGASVAALVFLGIGCSTAEKIADDALLPTTVSLDALNKAKRLTTELQAKDNEEAERTTNDITVAFVIPDGQDMPLGLEVEDETFGCNDTIVHMKRGRETASGDTVRDALTTLFAEKESTVGEAHNALAYSTLLVDRIVSRDGVTTEVELKGELVSAGACDSPRIKEQVEATVRWFRPNFKILLNGSESQWRCFGDESGLCE
ncbi:hypothetical protein ACFLZO_01335 [Patescibacteria group bacterium]